MVFQVKRQDAVAVYFPIVPKKIGNIDIRVSARSLWAADAVERSLLVEVSSRHNLNFAMCLSVNSVSMFLCVYVCSRVSVCFLIFYIC
jgi:hypothetical protein